MKFEFLSESESLVHCPFCDYINDDSSEMIDHMNLSHKGHYELYTVKSLEGDNNILHLAKQTQ